jgi:hypothetical protein
VLPNHQGCGGKISLTATRFVKIDRRSTSTHHLGAMRAGPSVDTLGSKIMGNLAAHRVPASPTVGLGDRLSRRIQCSTGCDTSMASYE